VVGGVGGECFFKKNEAAIPLISFIRQLATENKRRASRFSSLELLHS